MIIVRTPFRISFAGGGSDLKEFYSKNGYGAVVSAAIQKYMYITIHPYFHDKIRIKYSKTEDVDNIDEINHPLVRECLKMMGTTTGIEIASVADVPAGTGLGSSSSFTVCLLHALYAFKGKLVNKEKLAREACRIEIDVLREPIGKQDQYAASYGNTNYIRFNEDESVYVEPMVMTPHTKKRLEERLRVFYVGNPRSANQILSEQKKNISNEGKCNDLRTMVRLAEEAKNIINSGNIKRIGEILHEGWMLKKELSTDISNQVLDEYYETALKAGAIGGKLLGAGAGGFMLFYCEPKYQSGLKKALKLREFPIIFDKEGSKIIYFD